MIGNIKDHLLMNSIEDLLLINSLDAAALMEHYRLFFMGLLPFVFMVALIFEYFAQIDPEGLLKRAVISVLLLSCVGTFYHKSINASIAAADEIFKSEKARNPTLREAFTRAVLPSEVVEKAGKGGYFSAVVDFVKFHLITSKINVVLKAVITLIVVICFIILKVVYSLVYWLGFALFAIPCLIYLLPGMSKVLKGALISYLWCLTLPHVLVVVMSMLTRLIGHSHTSGRIIGDSVLGTALIFVMALMVAFVPVITSFILTGGGVSHAGGVIAAMGANFAMNMPKQAFNRASRYLLVNAGGPMGLARKLFKSERSKEKNHVSTTPKGGKNHVSKTNQGKNHEQKNPFKQKPPSNQEKSPNSNAAGEGYQSLLQAMAAIKRPLVITAAVGIILQISVLIAGLALTVPDGEGEFSPMEICYHGTNAIFQKSDDGTLLNESVLKDIKKYDFNFFKGIAGIDIDGATGCTVRVEFTDGVHPYRIKLEKSPRFKRGYRILDARGKK